MRPPHKLSFARLSTGTKMLLILSAAMLPLGFIALLTSLDLAESAAIERRAAAQTATALYAAQIEAVLESNLNGVRTLAVSTQSAEYICAALARQAHLKASSWPPTAAFDADRRKLCQSFGTPIDRLAPADPESDHVWLDARRRYIRPVECLRRGCGRR